MKNQQTSDTPDIEKHKWEERYQEETAPPWDTKLPAPELEQYFAALDKKPGNVLEVGCGTGTNAIWLAKQGCKVTATEIAPTALDKAKASVGGEKIDFHLLDICQSSPVSDSSQDFVFDRGVYHVIPKGERGLFIERIASALKPGGLWLSLVGSKDENRENPENGPPQLSAADLINLIEPFFEIIELNRSHFILPDGAKHLAWKALYRKRS